MPHFLINTKDINGDIISVSDKETLKHLAGSLRIRAGETLRFVDEKGIQYICEVTEVSNKQLKARILEAFQSARKLKFDLCLVLGVLKNEAQDLAIANATQLGVKSVYPVMCSNSTVSANIALKKNERWQKIAFESFKQCERADIPEIFDVSSLGTVLSVKNSANIIVFAEKNADTTLADALKSADLNSEIYAVVGPEGGFSDDEFEYFKQKNFPCVSLGNLILKAPNAVSVGLGNIIYETERLLNG